jgi:hypothetical protein
LVTLGFGLITLGDYEYAYAWQ